MRGLDADQRQADSGTGEERRRRGRGYPRWGRIAVVALAATGAVWAIGREAAKRIEITDIDEASHRQPPLPDAPKTTKTVDHNNTIMRMGLVGNPDGTAVAYDAEADHIAFNGRFRTDLTLAEAASLLHRRPNSLARRQAPDEIDPDAELFRAQAGVLTARAKERTREMRKAQSLAHERPDAVFSEWTITNYSFTLSRLNHPTPDEEAVLSAIADAAAEKMPSPGETMRAVGVNRGEIEPGRVAIAAGMLPVQMPEQRP
jgi:hypothetical protein